MCAEIINKQFRNENSSSVREWRLSILLVSFARICFKTFHFKPFGSCCTDPELKYLELVFYVYYPNEFYTELKCLGVALASKR